MSDFTPPDSLMIGWTTTATRAEAETLARGSVEAGLAVCAQIDESPITSFYRWEGKLETAQEFRVSIKFLHAQAGPLTAWIEAHHTYETPQWLCCRIDQTTEKYLMWARSSPT